MIKHLAKFLIKHNAALPRSPLHDFLKWSTLRDVIRNLGINCVLDVGANRGQFASTLRAIGYCGHIVSFEPSPHDFSILSKQFIGDLFWRGINYALGETNCIMSFNYVEKSTFLSSFNRLKQCDRTVQVIPVQVRRLDSIYLDIINGIEHPRVFLKMDTQGHDYEVLHGSLGIIEHILGIQSEIIVSSAYYEHTTPYHYNLSKYESLGYTLMGMFECGLCNKTKAVLEFDCIMARMIEFMHSCEIE